MVDATKELAPGVYCAIAGAVTGWDQTLENGVNAVNVPTDALNGLNLDSKSKEIRDLAIKLGNITTKVEQFGSLDIHFKKHLETPPELTASQLSDKGVRQNLVVGSIKRSGKEDCKVSIDAAPVTGLAGAEVGLQPKEGWEKLRAALLTNADESTQLVPRAPTANGLRTVPPLVDPGAKHLLNIVQRAVDANCAHVEMVRRLMKVAKEVVNQAHVVPDQSVPPMMVDNGLLKHKFLFHVGVEFGPENVATITVGPSRKIDTLPEGHLPMLTVLVDSGRILDVIMDTLVRHAQPEGSTLPRKLHRVARDTKGRLLSEVKDSVNPLKNASPVDASVKLDLTKEFGDKPVVVEVSKLKVAAEVFKSKYYADIDGVEVDGNRVAFECVGNPHTTTEHYTFGLEFNETVERKLREDELLHSTGGGHPLPLKETERLFESIDPCEDNANDIVELAREVWSLQMVLRTHRRNHDDDVERAAHTEAKNAITATALVCKTFVERWSPPPPPTPPDEMSEAPGKGDAPDAPEMKPCFPVTHPLRAIAGALGSVLGVLEDDLEAGHLDTDKDEFLYQHKMRLAEVLCCAFSNTVGVTCGYGAYKPASEFYAFNEGIGHAGAVKLMITPSDVLAMHAVPKETADMLTVATYDYKKALVNLGTIVHRVPVGPIEVGAWTGVVQRQEEEVLSTQHVDTILGKALLACYDLLHKLEKDIADNSNDAEAERGAGMRALAELHGTNAIALTSSAILTSAQMRSHISGSEAESLRSADSGLRSGLAHMIECVARVSRCICNVKTLPTRETPERWLHPIRMDATMAITELHKALLYVSPSRAHSRPSFVHDSMISSELHGVVRKAVKEREFVTDVEGHKGHILNAKNKRQTLLADTNWSTAETSELSTDELLEVATNAVHAIASLLLPLSCGDVAASAKWKDSKIALSLASDTKADPVSLVSKAMRVGLHTMLAHVRTHGNGAHGKIVDEVLDGGADTNANDVFKRVGKHLLAHLGLAGIDTLDNMTLSSVTLAGEADRLYTWRLLASAGLYELMNAQSKHSNALEVGKQHAAATIAAVLLVQEVCGMPALYGRPLDIVRDALGAHSDSASPSLGDLSKLASGEALMYHGGAGHMAIEDPSELTHPNASSPIDLNHKWQDAVPLQQLVRNNPYEDLEVLRNTHGVHESAWLGVCVVDHRAARLHFAERLEANDLHIHHTIYCVGSATMQCSKQEDGKIGCTARVNPLTSDAPDPHDALLVCLADDRLNVDRVRYSIHALRGQELVAKRYRAGFGVLQLENSDLRDVYAIPASCMAQFAVEVSTNGVGHVADHSPLLKAMMRPGEVVPLHIGVDIIPSPEIELRMPQSSLEETRARAEMDALAMNLASKGASTVVDFMQVSLELTELAPQAEDNRLVELATRASRVLCSGPSATIRSEVQRGMQKMVGDRPLTSSWNATAGDDGDSEDESEPDMNDVDLRDVDELVGGAMIGVEKRPREAEEDEVRKQKRKLNAEQRLQIIENYKDEDDSKLYNALQVHDNRVALEEARYHATEQQLKDAYDKAIQPRMVLQRYLAFAIYSAADDKRIFDKGTLDQWIEEVKPIDELIVSSTDDRPIINAFYEKVVHNMDKKVKGKIIVPTILWYFEPDDNDRWTFKSVDQMSADEFSETAYILYQAEETLNNRIAYLIGQIRNEENEIEGLKTQDVPEGKMQSLESKKTELNEKKGRSKVWTMLNKYLGGHAKEPNGIIHTIWRSVSRGRPMKPWKTYKWFSLGEFSRLVSRHSQHKDVLRKEGSESYMIALSNIKWDERKEVRKGAYDESVRTANPSRRRMLWRPPIGNNYVHSDFMSISANGANVGVQGHEVAGWVQKNRKALGFATILAMQTLPYHTDVRNGIFEYALNPEFTYRPLAAIALSAYSLKLAAAHFKLSPKSWSAICILAMYARLIQGEVIPKSVTGVVAGSSALLGLFEGTMFDTAMHSIVTGAFNLGAPVWLANVVSSKVMPKMVKDWLGKEAENLATNATKEVTTELSKSVEGWWKQLDNDLLHDLQLLKEYTFEGSVVQKLTPVGNKITTIATIAFWSRAGFLGVADSNSYEMYLVSAFLGMGIGGYRGYGEHPGEDSIVSWTSRFVGAPDPYALSDSSDQSLTAAVFSDYFYVGGCFLATELLDQIIHTTTGLDLKLRSDMIRPFAVNYMGSHFLGSKWGSRQHDTNSTYTLLHAAMWSDVDLGLYRAMKPDTLPQMVGATLAYAGLGRIALRMLPPPSEGDASDILARGVAPTSLADSRVFSNDPDEAGVLPGLAILHELPAYGLYWTRCLVDKCAAMAHDNAWRGVVKRSHLRANPQSFSTETDLYQPMQIEQVAPIAQRPLDSTIEGIASAPIGAETENFAVAQEHPEAFTKNLKAKMVYYDGTHASNAKTAKGVSPLPDLLQLCGVKRNKRDDNTVTANVKSITSILVGNLTTEQEGYFNTLGFSFDDTQKTVYPTIQQHAILSNTPNANISTDSKLAREAAFRAAWIMRVKAEDKDAYTKEIKTAMDGLKGLWEKCRTEILQTAQTWIKDFESDLAGGDPEKYSALYLELAEHIGTDEEAKNFIPASYFLQQEFEDGTVVTTTDALRAALPAAIALQTALEEGQQPMVDLSTDKVRYERMTPTPLIRRRIYGALKLVEVYGATRKGKTVSFENRLIDSALVCDMLGVVAIFAAVATLDQEPVCEFKIECNGEIIGPDPFKIARVEDIDMLCVARKMLATTRASATVVVHMELMSVDLINPIEERPLRVAQVDTQALSVKDVQNQPFKETERFVSIVGGQKELQQADRRLLLLKHVALSNNETLSPGEMSNACVLLSRQDNAETCKQVMRGAATTERFGTPDGATAAYITQSFGDITEMLQDKYTTSQAGARCLAHSIRVHTAAEALKRQFETSSDAFDKTVEQHRKMTPQHPAFDVLKSILVAGAGSAQSFFTDADPLVNAIMTIFDETLWYQILDRFKIDRTNHMEIVRAVLKMICYAGTWYAKKGQGQTTDVLNILLLSWITDFVGNYGWDILHAMIQPVSKLLDDLGESRPWLKWVWKCGKWLVGTCINRWSIGAGLFLVYRNWDMQDFLLNFSRLSIQDTNDLLKMVDKVTATIAYTAVVSPSVKQTPVQNAKANPITGIGTLPSKGVAMFLGLLPSLWLPNQREIVVLQNEASSGNPTAEELVSFGYSVIEDGIDEQTCVQLADGLDYVGIDENGTCVIMENEPQAMTNTSPWLPPSAPPSASPSAPPTTHPSTQPPPSTTPSNPPTPPTTPPSVPPVSPPAPPESTAPSASPSAPPSTPPSNPLYQKLTEAGLTDATNVSTKTYSALVKTIKEELGGKDILAKDFFPDDLKSKPGTPFQEATPRLLAWVKSLPTDIQNKVKETPKNSAKIFEDWDKARKNNGQRGGEDVGGKDGGGEEDVNGKDGGGGEDVNGKDGGGEGYAQFLRNLVAQMFVDGALSKEKLFSSFSSSSIEWKLFLPLLPFGRPILSYMLKLKERPLQIKDQTNTFKTPTTMDKGDITMLRNMAQVVAWDTVAELKQYADQRTCNDSGKWKLVSKVRDALNKYETDVGSEELQTGLKRISEVYTQNRGVPTKIDMNPSADWKLRLQRWVCRCALDDPQVYREYRKFVASDPKRFGAINTQDFKALGKTFEALTQNNGHIKNGDNGTYDVSDVLRTAMSDMMNEEKFPSPTIEAFIHEIRDTGKDDGFEWKFDDNCPLLKPKMSFDTFKSFGLFKKDYRPMDYLRAWHVHDVAKGYTTIEHVKMALLVSAWKSKYDKIVNDGTQDKLKKMFGRVDKMFTSDAMTRLGMLYLGRVIVIRGKTKRDKEEAKEMTNTALNNPRVVVLGVVHNDPKPKEYAEYFKQKNDNPDYSKYFKFWSLQKSSNLSKIIDSFYGDNQDGGWNQGYRVAILSMYDAIMPCAAMPTAPMQFDMSTIKDMPTITDYLDESHLG